METPNPVNPDGLLGPLNPSAWTDQKLAEELRASKSVIAGEAARRIEAREVVAKIAVSELVVDPARVVTYRDQGLPEGQDPTGIYVRAKRDGKFDAYDITFLTAESLRDFLRSRGGSNSWAEEMVFAIFGYPVLPSGKRIPA